MKFKSLLLATTLAVASVSGVAARAAVVTVNAMDDLYQAGGQDNSGGLAPQAIDVAGLTSITFSVSTGDTVTVNGGTYNDADGVGSVQGENNSGAEGISAISVPTAGFIAGVFEGAIQTATPAALNFDTGTGNDPGTTSFTSLAPEIQQAFFIGDGLTGDASGATQTFYVPVGATTLYLGLTDACGYNGSPSCFGDNSGNFTVTATGAGVVSAAPEPSIWALMMAGVGLAGAALRFGRRSGSPASA